MDKRLSSLTQRHCDGLERIKVLFMLVINSNSAAYFDPSPRYARSLTIVLTASRIAFIDLNPGFNKYYPPDYDGEKHGSLNAYRGESDLSQFSV